MGRAADKKSSCHVIHHSTESLNNQIYLVLFIFIIIGSSCLVCRVHILLFFYYIHAIGLSLRFDIFIVVYSHTLSCFFFKRSIRAAGNRHHNIIINVCVRPMAEAKKPMTVYIYKYILTHVGNYVEQKRSRESMQKKSQKQLRISSATSAISLPLTTYYSLMLGLRSHSLCQLMCVVRFYIFLQSSSLFIFPFFLFIHARDHYFWLFGKRDTYSHIIFRKLLQALAHIYIRQ